MTEIRSIGTAVPACRHSQGDILSFMKEAYDMPETEKRKMGFLYRQSGIETRHSVVPDYGRPRADWVFHPSNRAADPIPSLETRMEWYHRHATALSVAAVRDCLGDINAREHITHLITVSCTGLSAPGLDLSLMEALGLRPDTFRTSVNFMGCYAAIHALRIGDLFCRTDRDARVLIVCTELCTLHFRDEPSPDNIASSLLFADGAAAVLLADADETSKGPFLQGFHGYVAAEGRDDMAWQLSSTGFRMTLSGYVPDIIGADMPALVERALLRYGLRKEDVTRWCVHPGGRRILDAVEERLGLEADALQASRGVLRDYGNMSSPTVLYVLRDILRDTAEREERILGMAFGPGLTMETFLVTRRGQ